MLEDFRSAVRQLWRSPGFVLAAALSLALGTGANSALFSYIDGMFLRPMGVPDPDNVVRVFASTEQESKGDLTWPEFEALRSEVRSFRGVGALQRRGAVWSHGDERTDVMINAVSADFFQVMGVAPALGRLFGSGDTTEPVIVIGHHAWEKWFGADPAVIGKTMRLARGNPVNATIVGVLPATFRDVNAFGDRDVWMPPPTFLAMTPGSEDFVNRRNVIFEVFARLAPGKSIGQAQAEVGGVGERLRAAYPASNSRRKFEAILDFDYRLNRAGGLAVLVLLVVAVVMTIAAVNVANLFLARVEERRRELSVRAAMGASPWRLARQMLAESVLTGLAGLGLGVVVGSWIVRGLPAVMGLPAVVQHWARFEIDGRVFAATSAVAVLTALLFGLFPALAASRTELTPGLKSGPGQGGSGRMRLRHWLAVSQITICLVLLTCSALLIRSFQNAHEGDVGLSRNPMLVAWTGGRPEPVEREMVEKVQALPGVRKVALAFRAPLSHSGGGIALHVTVPGNRFFLENPAPQPVKYNMVTPEFFELMGVRLIRGRLFGESDRAGSEPVMVISEGMANLFWPGEDPTGRIVQSGSRAYRVIGVVANAPFNSLTKTSEPYLYTCFWQRNRGGEFTWLVGTTGPAGPLAPTLRATLRGIDAEMGRAEITTMGELIASAAQDFKVTAELVSGMGLLGLVLAGVGLYGVVARSVQLRTREIGIRMAIGAKRSEAAGLVLRQTLVMTGLAMLAGLPLSALAANALRSGLFGLSPWYPPAFVVAVLVLFAVAGLASWVPARRAASVDPVVALRAD